MHESHDTPGPVELEVRIPAGTIEIETVDGHTTEIDVDEDDVRIDVRPRSGGGHRIVIDQRPKKAFGWRTHEVNARIEIPHGAVLRGETGSGDLVVQGRLADVTFAAGSGDVNIERCEGDLALRAASGDIRVGDVTGHASVDTASGDVRVDEVGGDVTVRSASGDVHVVTAGGSVQVSTASGDITIEDVSRGRCVLNSMAGDIHVGVRRGTRVWLDISTTAGDASSDLSTTDPEVASGTGASLELQASTLSGDVSVERSMRSAA
jgi:DUF4097 and DUF4098 domain-containing protein YvlB